MEMLKDQCRKFIQWESYPRLKRIFAGFFLGSLFLYLFCRFYDSTAFPMNLMSSFSSLLLNLLWVSAILKTLFDLEHWKQWLPGLLLALAYALIYLAREDQLLLFLAVLTFGTAGMDHRKVLKIQTLGIAFLLLVSSLSAFGGIITNYIYVEDGNLRESFGICYPTDFASYLFFALLLFWIAWDELSDWVSILLILVVLFLTKQYNDSNTVAMCSAGFLGILICRCLWKRMDSGKRKKGMTTFLRKAVDTLLVTAFPILGAVMFGAIALYAAGTPLGIRLDRILNKRLTFPWRRMENSGISLLGSPLKQSGNGFSTFPNLDYDFVDSSYPLIVLQYGILVFALICLIWMYLSYRAVKAGDYRLALGMSLLALHAVSEHHFIEPNYNLLLFMPFASLSLSKTGMSRREESGEIPEKTGCPGSKKSIVAALVLGGGVLACVLLPAWILRLRTVGGIWRCAADGLTSDGIAAVKGFALASLFVLSMAGIPFLTFRLVKTRDNRGKVLPASGIVLCLLVVALEFFYMDRKIDRVTPEAEQVIAANKAILQELTQNAAGTVYDSELPAAYRREGIFVGNRPFAGENLVRQRGPVTLVVPGEQECIRLLRGGYEYAPISEYSAVYTKDSGVIETLHAMGIEAKSYFDKIRYVELPLANSPNLDLRKGQYAFNLHAKVQIPEGAQEGAQEAVRILIVGQYGRTVLYQEILTTEQIPGGDLEKTVQISVSGDTAGVKCFVTGAEGCSVEVEEISYQMTGNL